LSSTSSSDRLPKTRSATEILASRYRHLFVLPSTPLLLVYGGIATLALTILSKGTVGVLSFILAFAVFVLSGAAISSALQVIDRRTIATFRRAQALLLGGDILWLLIAAVGAGYAWFSGSAVPLTNALLFGAFVCAGFEFLVIGGVFEKSAPLSLALAAIHPASTLVIVRLPELSNHLDLIAASSGVVTLALLVAFPILLERKRTSLGHDALSLFQAFMKTWTAGRSDELEKVIADHSEEVQVTTKVLRFRTDAGDTFLVLPGVHPGPFHPVGSYDLPGVISRAFKELGPVMTLHRPGGHERNLATRAETLKYALSVSELARSVTPENGRAVLRGPIHAQVGRAAVCALAFSEDMIVTVSFAPLGSDDLDTRVEAELTKPASAFGFDLSVVDAHNSIDHNLESPATEDPGWSQLFEATSKAKPVGFGVAYSHSSEVGFVGRSDLTENGIGLFLVQSEGTKCALVLADANNSVPEMREEVSRALSASGYGLIEFCTSDSHNLAARGLTVERGYEALGEATPPPSIADLVTKLAKLADTRLAPADYGSTKMESKVRVFGSKALEEFAAITQSSSRFSRSYFRFAVVAVAVLLVASVFF
jgi:putative membrane protein